MFKVDYFKMLLREKNITQKDLSEKTGIPLGTIRSISSSLSTNPAANTVVKIADFFKVSMDDFFDREYHPQKAQIGDINGNGNQIQQGLYNSIKNSEKEISYLKNLVEEKERLIQILLSKK